MRVGCLMVAARTSGQRVKRSAMKELSKFALNAVAPPFAGCRTDGRSSPSSMRASCATCPTATSLPLGNINSSCFST